MERPSAKRIRGVSRAVQDTAQALRHGTTEPEAMLWECLRGRRLCGVRFRRQHPVGRFVLDFYAPAFHLAVEIDGPSHDGNEEFDASRTQELEAFGYRVLRFRNEQVRGQLPSVLETIRATLEASGAGPDAGRDG